MCEIPKTKYGLSLFRSNNKNITEIGVDESGRGPMFGRVYAAAVVLPKSTSIPFDDLRDSKKIKSFKKLSTLSEYIKKNAVAWSVCYEDETTIDAMNIRQATFSAMHRAIKNVEQTFNESEKANLEILVDGNDFKPYMTMKRTMLVSIPHTCYEGGDNTFISIAAASILAKTARDTYILKMCDEHPELKDRYSIHTNKGYGTRKHMDGIIEFGITPWHRKTYGICKTVI